MKTTTKKQRNQISTVTPSHIPSAPNAVIAALLREKLKPKTEGAKNQIDALCRAAEFLLQNYPSFGLADFHKHCKAYCDIYNISYPEMEDFFEKFVKHFIQFGKISPVIGAYGASEPIYIVQSR